MNAANVSTSSLFISHSHADKAIARRVARRLDAYGIKVWLDERELRLGDVLSPVIGEHIAASSAVIVIATSAAVSSDWVSKELAFACSLKPPRPVYPFLVEALASHPLLTDHLGLDASDRHHFERAVLKLAAAVVGTPLPAPSAGRLRAGLDALAAEDRRLSLLIDDCLQGEGLLINHVETVAQADFHNLDYALNGLYDVADEERKLRIAYAAAALFRRRGVGTYALENHLVAGPRDDGVLRNAVGDPLDPTSLDAALGLLATSKIRDDQSLANFITSNAKDLNETQQQSVVRLVTHPDRGPAGFGVDAAFVALKALPDSVDLGLLWERWIRNGRFDGLAEGGDDPVSLAPYLSQAVQQGLIGWDNVVKTFLNHVKTLARSRDRDQVEAAVDHLVAAAEMKSPLLNEVAQQCASAPGAAEWDGWEHAQEMGIYIHAHVQAALGNRHRVHALEEYETSWNAVRRVNELRSKRRRQQSAD